MLRVDNSSLGGVDAFGACDGNGGGGVEGGMEVPGVVAALERVGRRRDGLQR